jgi:hypothetical protein
VLGHVVAPCGSPFLYDSTIGRNGIGNNDHVCNGR